ncbi:type II toxin-antitoxin system RelE/ParE family toxin [Desulfotignum balticum]|uniref:type II toxin-antitoxin system RelE/ParE family toxin n=1 Tax=Desulfotignum balticum TaxID=115781 RepID=UPI000462A0AB|nr:type II toxin-antitoxin system RelE/ParE family toxin [Desulfotignum balticum]
MSFIVHIRPEAETDLEEAALWYEKQNPRLGDEFLDEVQGIFKILSENPYLYAVTHKNTRRALVHRFPFGVYYLIDQNSIIVVAVMHGSRHPKRWQKRT